jgi:hypothetical protein
MHEIFNQLLNSEFADAFNFVLTELPNRLKDETYHRAYAWSIAGPSHKEFVICRAFESIGAAASME